MQAMSAVNDTAYRALFEANPQPMWVFERSSLCFLAVNDAALRQYGYTRDEFLDLTILDIRPEEDAAEVTGSVENVLSVPKIWRHRRKDGSPLLAEVTAHNIEFLGAEARLVLAHDVTLRERHAEMLRRTNQTLEAVLRAAPVGVLVFDAKGGATETNEAAREMLGDRGLEPLAPAVEAILRGETSATVEVAVAGGRWIEVSARAVETGPSSNGAVVILTEITDHRTRQGRLSRDLQNRTAALRASDEALEEFCFSVSHDLRGPLRAVDGFAQLVLSDEEVRLSQENRDALERVRRAGRRMGELIDGLQVLSRISRKSIEPSEINLSALFMRKADAASQAYPERQVRFEVEPGLRVVGDPRLVGDLIERLVDNSVKFKASEVVLASDGAGFVLRDNGVGFDMAFSSRLFRPFERLHPSSDFPGSGLGLAIASRIVKRHGGTIGAEGTLGSGTVVRFSLCPNDLE